MNTNTNMNTKSSPAAVATRFLALIPRLLLAFVARLLLLPSPPKPPAPSPPPLPPSPPRAQSRPRDDPAGLFRMFDHDNDGKITAVQLTETLANLGIFVAPRDLAAAIAEVDVDRDGCVDEEEFAELYGKLVAADADEEEELREAFDVFDEDGDGFITAEELRTVMAALGLEQGTVVEQCKRMIGSVDVDGDGRVDFEEFKVMMRRSEVWKPAPIRVQEQVA